MSIHRALGSGFADTTDFKGRASRIDFCIFTGFWFLVSVLLVLVNVLTGRKDWWILMGWNILTIVPLISIAVRRLHDVGRSGWWLLQIVASLLLVNTLRSREDPLNSVAMLFSTIVILLGIPVVYSLFLPGYYSDE